MFRISQIAPLLGSVMWNFLAEATNGGMTSVVGHGDLLRKIHFPKITVTIASIMSALINFGINLIVMIFFHPYQWCAYFV